MPKPDRLIAGGHDVVRAESPHRMLVRVHVEAAEAIEVCCKESMYILFIEPLDPDLFQRRQQQDEEPCISARRTDDALFLSAVDAGNRLFGQQVPEAYLVLHGHPLQVKQLLEDEAVEVGPLLGRNGLADLPDLQEQAEVVDLEPRSAGEETAAGASSSEG